MGRPCRRVIHGREHIVLVGEVDPAVDSVLLFYDTPPDRALSIVGQPLGRRIWISHPHPWTPPMHVSVAWLHGRPESFTLDQGGWGREQ